MPKWLPLFTQTASGPDGGGGICSFLSIYFLAINLGLDLSSVTSWLFFRASYLVHPWTSGCFQSGGTRNGSRLAAAEVFLSQEWPELVLGLRRTVVPEGA